MELFEQIKVVVDLQNQALSSGVELGRSESAARINELESTFKHYHVSNGVDDACKQCGLDLRDPIHTHTVGVIKEKGE